MKRTVAIICLICLSCIPGLSQWKPVPMHPSFTRSLKNSVSVEVNPAKARTRVTNRDSGRMHIIRDRVAACGTTGKFLWLRAEHVINNRDTEVVFYLYQLPDCQFIRKVTLHRPTNDPAIVEFGEWFAVHETIPDGNGLFFVLHEDCEGAPTGKKAYLYAGPELGRHAIIPLPNRLLALWVHDDLTKLTIVDSRKRVIQKSLTTNAVIWQLGPEDFSCQWFNYEPRLFLNRIICINGINNPTGYVAYYFIDVNDGSILSCLSSDTSLRADTLMDHCRTLSP